MYIGMSTDVLTGNHMLCLSLCLGNDDLNMSVSFCTCVCGFHYTCGKVFASAVNTPLETPVSNSGVSGLSLSSTSDPVSC